MQVLALVIIGFAVKALFWLAIVGIALFVTGIFGGDSPPHQLMCAGMLDICGAEEAGGHGGYDPRAG